MKSSFIFAFVFLFGVFSHAQQGSFSVKIDKDTMFTDEVVKVEFYMDNLTGNFKAPDFSGFRLAAGPNTSSSMSIINGEVNQKKSYTYILMPDKSGTLVINSAVLKTEDDSIETDPVNIVVLDAENGSDRNISRKQKSFKKEIDRDVSDFKTEKSKNKRVLKKI
jgi:BatD DUF11 like domain